MGKISLSPNKSYRNGIKVRTQLHTNTLPARSGAGQHYGWVKINNRLINVGDMISGLRPMTRSVYRQMKEDFDES